MTANKSHLNDNINACANISTVQCQATTCNRRGTCIELANGFSCTCDQGFYGNNCENVTSCPVITKPDHSAVKCEGTHGKNHFQSVCTFICDQGFILNGNNSSTCRASGSWTTYNTICHEQNNACNDLPMQQNTSAYESHGVYILSTPRQNIETPQDQIYANSLSTHQVIYENLE
ncbi:L-selectin-like [Heptranchias perlo]|uniref:L-selectin-like n=1 Tax=Heptranchias perlo TaxID=212740 RepID=UPI003559B3AB